MASAGGPWNPRYMQDGATDAARSAIAAGRGQRHCGPHETTHLVGLGLGLGLGWGWG